MNTCVLSYVLITPARNEEAFLEETIHSVMSQTVLPKKWVIVSDGSTDRTDDIAKKYLTICSWIELVRMPERRDRNFAAKVRCFNAGAKRVQDEAFDIIGNLDADVTFGSGYFEYLLSKFVADAQLGVAGTPFVEGDSAYDYRFTPTEHVSGACQLFRRECFNQIGGYVQVKGGGIDWIAVTTARMKGWRTQTFLDHCCYHHRPMGTASVGRLRSNFRLGQQDYYLGGHPLWQFSRACYQMTRWPYLVGGLGLFAGYVWGWLIGLERPVSADLVRFHQREQIDRLMRLFNPIRVVRKRKAEVDLARSQNHAQL